MQAGRLQEKIKQKFPKANVEVRPDWPGQMRIYADGKLLWKYNGSKKISDEEAVALVAMAV